MLPGLAISAFSFVLLAYWFRYTCLLILSTRPAKDLGGRFAETNHLELPHVREALCGAPAPGQMDALRCALNSDYDTVTGILRHTACFQPAAATPEERMLMLDYRLLNAAYAALRWAGREAGACRALAEMTAVVAHLANAAAQRAAIRSGA